MISPLNVGKNWITVALSMSLAALTNHSRGDVVYKKLSSLKAADGEAAEALCRPQSDGNDDKFSTAEVLKIQPSGTVLLTGGRRAGFLPGTLLEARRPSRIVGRDGETRWIPTGLLRITEVREDYSLAQLTEDGSKDSGVYFPETPGLMVGDRAEAHQQQIIQSLRILPTRILSYRDLFIDPKSSPASFELSDAGRALLLEQAQPLMAAHAPLLLIEGHTDPRGDSQSNQVESYQRAMTVRQALIEAFHLTPDRVLAVGLGETELLDEPYLPGRDEESRRIVLKVKAQTNRP